MEPIEPIEPIEDTIKKKLKLLIKEVEEIPTSDYDNSSCFIKICSDLIKLKMEILNTLPHGKYIFNDDTHEVELVFTDNEKLLSLKLNFMSNVVSELVKNMSEIGILTSLKELQH